MILEAFAMDRVTDPSSADGGLPKGAGEEAMAQKMPKGRFCVAKSFVTASNILAETPERRNIQRNPLTINILYK